MRVATWNVAAVNNNPFEYWVTHPDPEYTRLMQAVERLIDEPGAQDVTVGSIFTEEMFVELRRHMDAESWAGAAETEALWRTDFRERRIISGFLKDGSLGKKRLASMPDRFTNTITAADGSLCLRPSVINSFTGPMQSLQEWWGQWLSFMFAQPIQIAGRDGKPTAKRPVELLCTISRAKYPDVTESEERISLPLQVLCLALFDAILVHSLNRLAPSSWQPLKQQLVRTLVLGKQARTAELICRTHAATDVFCVQEASAGLARLLEAQLPPGRFVVCPKAIDPSRDQNSLVVLSSARFMQASVREVTDAVIALLPSASLAPGDLLAFTVQGAHAGGAGGGGAEAAGGSYLLASFHGDTNGLQTAPLIAALSACAARLGAEAGEALRLLVGLDANTYSNQGGKLDPAKFYLVDQFATDCAAAGLLNCWPAEARWEGALTTFNARTYLQPQLNKACRYEQMRTHGDRNPKVRCRLCRRTQGLQPVCAQSHAYLHRVCCAAGPHTLLSIGLRGGWLLSRQHGRQHLPGGACPSEHRLPLGPLHCPR